MTSLVMTPASFNLTEDEAVQSYEKCGFAAVKKVDNEPTTIVAHFDGSEYTEEELEEIKNFAEFVKNKR